MIQAPGKLGAGDTEIGRRTAVTPGVGGQFFHSAAGGEVAVGGGCGFGLDWLMRFMQIGDTRRMTRMVVFLFVLLGSCAVVPPRPELAACLARMETHAANLRPTFTAMGYRPEVYLRLDEDLADGRGFRKSESTLGDASPGGAIRLRPSRLCADEVLARAVVAHEMAHVSLQHRSVPGSGVTALWEKPSQQEIEADELAYAVLMRAGGDVRAAMLVSCWLGKCDRQGKPGARWRDW